MPKPMNDLSQDLQKQVQQVVQYIQNETKQLESLTSQKQILKNEIVQLDRRKTAGIEAIEAELAQRKSEVEVAFAKSKNDLQTELEALAQRVLIAKEETKRAESGLKKAQEAFDKQHVALQELESNIHSRVEEHNSLVDELDLKEKRIASLDTQVEEHKHTLRELDAETASVRKGLDALQQQVGMVQVEIMELTKQHEIKKDQANRELVEIQRQLQRAINQLRDTQAKDEATRQDLASRAMALEKREEVVKKREFLAKSAKTEYQKLNDYLKL